MGKSLEEVLAELTGQQIRAIVLKVWSALGGRDNFGDVNVRRLLAGELRLMIEETVEEIVPQQPVAKPPLIGTVVKTLHLNPYKAKWAENAIVRGRYSNQTSALISIARRFASDEVGLIEPVSVELVQFNRDPNYDEVLVWAKENLQNPILPKHLYAIGFQHAKEQHKATIVAFGSVRDQEVLTLSSFAGRRYLHSTLVATRWPKEECPFGFFSE